MTHAPLLLAVLVKGALVLALAALAARALRRAPAAARHGVWVAAFVGLLLLPVLEAAGPLWTVGVLPAPAPLMEDDHANVRLELWTASAMPAPATVVLPAPPVPPAPPAPPAPPVGGLGAAAFRAGAAAFDAHVAEFEAEAAAFETEAAHFEADAAAYARDVEALPADGVGVRVARVAERRAPWASAGLWLAGAWALGAALVALGWASALASATRLVRTARPETDDEWAVLADRARRLSGLPEPVRLLRSSVLDVPIAWGLGRPAVVLPASADTWADGRREAVLLHEMAHLRRRDAWTGLAAQAALALHWPNPLAWWAYRRFLDAREQACDDAVLQGGARPSDYAEHLVGVARGLRRDRAALAAVAPMARRAGLEGRVVSILDGARRRRLSRGAQVATVGLAGLVVLPVVAPRPVAQEAPPEPFAVAHAAAPVEAAGPVAHDTTDAWVEVEAAAETARQRADVVPTPPRAPTPPLPPAPPGFESEWFSEASWREAMDEAGAALAELDLDAIVAEALASVDEIEVRAEVEAALREARAEVRQDAARARAEARAEARAPAHELAEIERVRAEHAIADAQREARLARDRARQAQRDAERRAAPAQTPAPRPAPAARPAPAPVDWQDVDRARREAARRSDTTAALFSVAHDGPDCA